MGRLRLPAAIRNLALGPTRAAAASKPPPFLAFRSSVLFIIFTVCLAIFTDIFLYGLIVPVIPFSLTEQAGVPEEEVQKWTAILLACYNAALCVGSPIAGFYADHTASRRGPLLLGLLALAGSTLLLCLGTTVALLVVGRLLQGLSAAVVWSVGLALLVDTVGKGVGQSMGYVGIAMSVGLLISPVIGGAVYAAAGYYAVYYIAFALICCDIALRLVLVERKVAQQWLDTTSDSDHDRASNGNSRSSDISPGAASPSEEKPRSPHMELIKSKRITAILFAVVVEAGLVFACDTVIPLFVKDVFSWDSTAAGLVFICIMVPGFVSPLVGALADRHGAKWTAIAGFTLSVPLVACLRFVTQNTVGHKVLFCALLTLLGATLLALVNTVLMAATTYAIDDEEAKRPGVWGEKGVYASAYGLWTTCYALGGTIGSLMAGYLNAGPGWGTLTWSLAVWCAAGMVVSFGLGPAPTKKDIGSRQTTIDAAAHDSRSAAP